MRGGFICGGIFPHAAPGFLGCCGSLFFLWHCASKNAVLIRKSHGMHIAMLVSMELEEYTIAGLHMRHVVPRCCDKGRVSRALWVCGNAEI